VRVFGARGGVEHALHAGRLYVPPAGDP
jgi:hypothetical protein